jgi:peptidoglycan glycosyltransferase
MYDGVIMARTSGLLVALLLATAFASAAAAETPLLRGDTIRLAGRRYVADLTDGGHAELTLDPQMQQSTENLLWAFQIPFGAAVVVSVPDGRVLALVGASAADPRLGAAELALRPWAPAASVFKVVSAAALVENGVLGSARTCYHGGVSSIVADNLVDLPAIDRRCDTLAFGLGKSQNAIIAKFATRHLTAGDLTRIGRSFGFDEPIPFDLPIEPSRVSVTPGFLDDPVAVAETAFGQGELLASPLQMALVAAGIANEGEVMRPYLVQELTAPDGGVLRTTRPMGWKRGADPEAARQTAAMMVNAVEFGGLGNAYVPGLSIGGKTGTAETGSGDPHAWFIGFAGLPGEAPRCAVAVIIEAGGGGGQVALPIGRDLLVSAVTGP